MTHTAKHTPGPWEARIGKGDLKLGQYPSKAMHFTIESGTRKLMAMGEAWKCEDDPTMFSEVTANAHLIAAAPAMYEALRRIKVLMESGDIEGKDWIEYGQIVQALAQAEGKQ